MQNFKKRYCECGRELEKYCSLCSECVTINAQLSKDIYASTEAHIESQKKYNQSEKGKLTRRKAHKTWRDKNIEAERQRSADWKRENKDKIKNYNKQYYLSKKKAS